MDELERLRATPLFKNLGPEEAEAMESIAQVRKFNAGALLFHAGDPAREFFVVLSGSVRICRLTPEGKQLTLHVVQPGHLFAEAAALSMSTYPASAEAVDDVCVAAFDGDAFRDVLERHHTVAVKLILSLSSWVRELAHKLEERSLKGVLARVAGHILEEWEREGEDTFRLSQTKTLAAEQMGMTAESFSRALRRLQDLELIRVKGRAFSVLKAEELRRLAEG